jgi:hypothetical protein
MGRHAENHEASEKKSLDISDLWLNKVGYF